MEECSLLGHWLPVLWKKVPSHEFHCRQDNHYCQNSLTAPSQENKDSTITVLKSLLFICHPVCGTWLQKPELRHIHNRGLLLFVWHDLRHFCLFLIFLLIFFKFIYFWPCWVFVAVRGFLQLQCVGFLLRWLLLLQNTGSRFTGFSSCGTLAQQLWLMGSRAQAQQLWQTGLVVPWHVGSSRTRAQTRVPCIGRRILNHCTTREVSISYFSSVH